MSTDHGPVMVMMPKQPDEIMMADVAECAERFYGTTPAKLEAIGFFMAAYSSLMTNLDQKHAERSRRATG